MSEFDARSSGVLQIVVSNLPLFTVGGEHADPSRPRSAFGGVSQFAAQLVCPSGSVSERLLK